jgi:hypothetical protein
MTAEIWPEKPAEARRKCLPPRRRRNGDVRWTLKVTKTKPCDDGRLCVDIAIPVFGYKSHISIDRRHGIIRRRKITDAAARGGALRDGLIRD